MSPFARRLMRLFSFTLLFIVVGAIGALAQEDTPAPAQDSTVYLPAVMGSPPSQVLIAAAYIDSAVSYEPDEAILLWNVGAGAQSLAGWSLRAGAKTATFPLTTTLRLEAGSRLWCTANTDSFRRSFGVDAGCAWSSADNGALLLDGALTLNNNGGAILLRNSRQEDVDMLLYGATTQQSSIWLGPPALLYTRGLVTGAGQVWQRKLDPNSGLPIDSNSARDWAGDLEDLEWGRRVRQPGWGGWDRSDGLWPAVSVDSAVWTVAVGPEGLYQPMVEFFRSATHSLDLSLYTFEHPSLALALAEAAQRGVQVRMLLDGAPPGGITNVQKWCVSRIAEAGGDIRYMAVTDDAPKGYKRRYRFLHAKYGIADGRSVFVGTENPTLNAMPEPTGAPVGGRRGFYLFTDATGVAAALNALFASDWRPTIFADLRPYDPTHAKYGAPPADFVLPPPPVFVVADAPFGEAMTIAAHAESVVVNAPENAMRVDAGIQGLVNRAGAGDEIVFVQMYENKFFGETVSNPIADPNPRLEAAINAARRGARVRLLLDGYFDDEDALRNNQATVAYVRTIAAAEHLDLDARLANPTAGGIHAKLALVRLGEQRWSAVGSLNGGETSHKLNREVVLLVENAVIHARLHSVFEHDWALGEE
ncbi:MAG: hypothetical protein KJZ95_03145 [Caldilinea sp.]|nr:hypothetical protein [Caldilinea sp.]